MYLLKFLSMKKLRKNLNVSRIFALYFSKNMMMEKLLYSKMNFFPWKIYTNLLKEIDILLWNHSVTIF